MKIKFKFVLLLTTGFWGFACAKKASDNSSTVATASIHSLYVSSGSCYSGTGNTVPAASNIVYKVNLDTGATDSILADYTISTETAGNSPVSIIDYDNDNMLVMVENATTPAGRRIEKVAKKTNLAKTSYYANATALGSVLRTMARNSSDGTILFSRSAVIEKINATPTRMTIGASTAWVTSPAGNCTNSATFISSVQVTATGKIIYTHANAAQNKIGVISTNGYTTAADCIMGTAVNAPVASAFPTASVYLPDYKQLLVLYASNATTTDFNVVYAYDFDDTTGNISNPVRAFMDSNVLYGGSAMAYDASTKSVYVATANSTSTTIANYNIEKFAYDPTTKLMTRAGNVPFATGWTGSKCISSMFVGL